MTTQAPMMATKKLYRLKPVTPGWPNWLKSHPPTSAPIIPMMISMSIPCDALVFITTDATHPAIAPKSIHSKKFI